MIAPLRETNEPCDLQGMPRARRLVAHILLHHRSDANTRRIALWKAWLLAAWALAATTAIVAHRMGWI